MTRRSFWRRAAAAASASGCALPSASGSTTAAAGATALERFFPENSKSLEQQVVDNGMSRIYAGIHYRMDVEAGQRLGRSVAQWAIHYDNTNGLLAALLPGYRGNDDR